MSSGKEGFEGGSQSAQTSLDQVRQGWVLVHGNTRQGSLMFPELEIAYLPADTVLVSVPRPGRVGRGQGLGQHSPGLSPCPSDSHGDPSPYLIP